MWAFAIWDDLEKSLFLSRDRFGVKPLYYQFFKEKSFTFASEIHAFKSSFFDLSLNKEHVLALLHEPSCLDPLGLTPYDNLHLLPAGHSLVIDKNLNSCSPFKWWNLTENEIDDSDEIIGSEFSRLLDEGCKIRLRSDSTISNSIKWRTRLICSIHKGKRSRNGCIQILQNHRSCYNMAFENSLDSEHVFAESIASYLNQTCNFVSIESENLWNELSLLTGHFGDFSVTPLSCISPLYRKISADSFKISLDGHGGDECLMGYPDMIEAAIKIATPKNRHPSKLLWKICLKTQHTPQNTMCLLMLKLKLLLVKLKKWSA